MYRTNPMKISYETKSELLQKLEAIKENISKADKEYQFAFARGDFESCGVWKNTLAFNRKLFGYHIKYQIKRGWL